MARNLLEMLAVPPSNYPPIPPPGPPLDFGYGKQLPSMPPPPFTINPYSGINPPGANLIGGSGGTPRPGLSLFGSRLRGGRLPRFGGDSYYRSNYG